MFRTALASVQKSAVETSLKNDAQDKFSDPADEKGSTYSWHNEFSEVTLFIDKLVIWGIVKRL